MIFAQRAVTGATLVVFFLLMMSPQPALCQVRAGEVLKQSGQGVLKPAGKGPPSAPAAGKKPLIKKEEGQRRKTVAADTTPIFVKRIVVEGGALLGAKELGRIIHPVEGRQHTLGELQEIANRITKACRAKGYITSYAYIPEQEVRDGVVRMKIEAGMLGDVTVKGNRSYDTDYIRGYIEKLRKAGPLNEKTLLSQLMLLNENPSLKARALLRAGKERGATDVEVTVKDKRPLYGTLGFDNFGTGTISRERLVGRFGVGNLVLDGDLLRVDGMTGLRKLDLNSLSYGRVDYQAPVDFSGTRLGAYYTNALYEAGGSIAELGLNGKAHVVGVYGIQPLVRGKRGNLTLKGTFEYKNVTDYLLSSLNSRDKIRTVALDLDYAGADALGGANRLVVGWTRGIRGILGGTGANDPESSRLGADGNFDIFTLAATRRQALGRHTSLVISANGQYSNDRLFVAEQYQVGGAYSVRGYPPAYRIGDSGYTASAELWFNIWHGSSKGRPLSAYLVPFIDHAGVFVNDPQPGEDKAEYLTSPGIGARLYWGRWSARVDWAVPRLNGGFCTGDARTDVQVTVSF